MVTWLYENWRELKTWVTDTLWATVVVVATVLIIFAWPVARNLICMLVEIPWVLWKVLIDYHTIPPWQKFYCHIGLFQVVAAIWMWAAAVASGYPVWAWAAGAVAMVAVALFFEGSNK